MAKSRPKAAANGTGHARDESPKACYVLSLTVENVRCFGAKQKLDLSNGKEQPAQWTIILGENGTGKTTLLQALLCFGLAPSPLPRKSHSSPLLAPRFGELMLREIILGKPVDGFDQLGLVRTEQNARNSRCEVRVNHTLGIKGSSSDDSVIAEWHFQPDGSLEHSYISSLICYAYGAGRRLGSSSLTQANSDDPAGTLFDEHATLRNAEEWLLRLDYSSSKPSEIRAQQKERLEQVKQLLVSILPDVEDIRFTTPTGPNPTPRVEFQTFSGWVPLRRLGYGYQTLIAWVTDFASRMVERYPDSPDPLKEPAIVVVDEIDLHLHPTWQRKLISFLSDRFPNTQFIATAHSPLVVQAAENANLAVLKRVGDHVEIINDVDEIRGWRIDQILTSDLFGLKSARPPEVEALFARKQQLLDKAKRTTREETELRELQARIDKLPVGDSAHSVKEMEAIRQALELLKEQQPK
jgi:predicted ATP-binding protein involved in virulence